MNTWVDFTGPRFREAGGHAAEIRRGAAAAVQDDPRARTAILTLLAGSGSRWVRSIEVARSQGRARGAAIDFDLRKPRGLFPVENLLADCGHANLNGSSNASDNGTIPIAAYSLAAVQGLGQHILITSGFEREIEQEILQPLGFPAGSWEFRRQETFCGKPLGHGAAALQALPLWQDYDYVICNFGGDANSRTTVETAQLVLAALDAAGDDTALLLPAALVDHPAYSIRTDAQGRPTGFSHAKLQGEPRNQDRKPQRGTAPGWSNVGVRAYRSQDLAAALHGLHRQYWDPDYGYRIPGNRGNELALDNADALFAAQRRARLLATARAEEITPAKTLEDVPRFLRAVAELQAAAPAGC